MSNISLTLLLLLSPLLMNAQQAYRRDTTIIEWDPIRDADILWRKQVWRIADVSNPNNLELQCGATTPAEHVLANVLVSGIRAGKYSAYRGDDTDFASAMPIFDLNAALHCDTCTFPQQVHSYVIKENWIFDRNRGAVVVRIQGIGAATTTSNDSPRVLFWVKYPEARTHLARFEAYGKSSAYRYNWNEYFESRQFSSRIVKTDGQDAKAADNKETLPPLEKKRKRKKKHRVDELSPKEKEVWNY